MKRAPGQEQGFLYEIFGEGTIGRQPERNPQQAAGMRQSYLLKLVLAQTIVETDIAPQLA